MTISLAFLAPNLVKAAVEGRLPGLSDFACGYFKTERTGRSIKLVHLKYGTGRAD